MQAALDHAFTPELASDVSASASCESAQPAHAADHAAVCRGGCGLTLLMCGAHLDGLRRMVAGRAATGERFGCVLCRTTETSLDAVFEVSRIDEAQ